jgi:hypothetical protein
VTAAASSPVDPAMIDKLERIEAARARVRALVDELELDEVRVLERVAEGLGALALARSDKEARR